MGFLTGNVLMAKFTIKRLSRNPIITPEHFGEKAGLEGYNINGPSLIRVPDWVDSPLGKYYLYFGHHQGKYIRLAYADEPEGPYTFHDGGVLSIPDSLINMQKRKKKTNTHIASPDVHVFEDKKEIWMYFHANIRGKGAYKNQGQTSFLAISKDGLNFKIIPRILGPFYMRVFQHEGMFYSIAKNDNLDAILIRSQDGKTMFEPGPSFELHYRHGALLKRGNIMHVFFTRAFEMQESILHATMNLEENWMDWTLSESELVLKPEHDWEGANLPKIQSRYGGAAYEVNAIRDPCIFEEEEKIFLLYSVKGEKGIAIARIEGL